MKNIEEKIQQLCEDLSGDNSNQLKITQGFEISDKPKKQLMKAENGAIGREFVKDIVNSPDKIFDLTIVADDQASFKFGKCDFFVDLNVGTFEVHPTNGFAFSFSIDVLGHEAFDALVNTLDRSGHIDETTTTSSVGGQYSSKYFLDPNNGKGRKPLWPGGAIIEPNRNQHEYGINSFKVKKGVVEESELGELTDQIIIDAVNAENITKLAHFYSKGLMSNEIIAKAIELKGQVFANRIKIKAKESLNENDNIYLKDNNVMSRIVTKEQLLKEWDESSSSVDKHDLINSIVGGEDSSGVEEISIDEDNLEEGRPFKINQKEYTTYVVQFINEVGKIAEGFEYPEDAKERAKEMLREQGIKKDPSIKILTRIGLKKYGLDANDNSNWADPQWLHLDNPEMHETSTAGGVGGQFSKPLDEDDLDEGLFDFFKKKKDEPQKRDFSAYEVKPQRDDEKVLKIFEKIKASPEKISFRSNSNYWNGYEVVTSYGKSGGRMPAVGGWAGFSLKKNGESINFLTNSKIINEIERFFQTIKSEEKEKNKIEFNNSIKRDLELDETDNQYAEIPLDEEFASIPELDLDEDEVIDNKEVISSEEGEEDLTEMYSKYMNEELDDVQCFEMFSKMAQKGEYPNEEVQHMAEALFEDGFLNEDGTMNETAIFGEEGEQEINELNVDGEFQRSVWNDLIKVLDNPEVSDEDKAHAKMLLGQYNTASGRRMRDEIVNFINGLGGEQIEEENVNEIFGLSRKEKDAKATQEQYKLILNEINNWGGTMWVQYDNNWGRQYSIEELLKARLGRAASEMVKTAQLLPELFRPAKYGAYEIASTSPDGTKTWGIMPNNLSSGQGWTKDGLYSNEAVKEFLIGEVGKKLGIKLPVKEKEVEEGTIYAGATSVPSIQKDPTFLKLNAKTKMDLQNNLKTGNAVSLGENSSNDGFYNFDEWLKDEGIIGYSERIHNILSGQDEEFTPDQLEEYLDDPDGNGFGIFGYTNKIVNAWNELVNGQELDENLSPEEIEANYLSQHGGKASPEAETEESDDDMFDRLLSQPESESEWGDLGEEEDLSSYVLEEDLSEYVLEEDFSMPGHVKSGLNKIHKANEKNEKDSEKEAGFNIKHTNPQGVQFVEKLPSDTTNEDDLKKADSEPNTKKIASTISKGMEDLDYQNELTPEEKEKHKNGLKPIIKSDQVKDQFGHVTKAMPHANVSDSSDKIGDDLIANAKKKADIRKDMPMYNKEVQPTGKQKKELTESDSIEKMKKFIEYTPDPIVEAVDIVSPLVVNLEEGNDDDIIKEGEGYAITRAEQKAINEEIARMNKLMGYNPKDILSTKVNKTSKDLFEIKKNK